MDWLRIAFVLGMAAGALTGTAQGAQGQCNGQTQYAKPKGEWSSKYEWRSQLLASMCLTGGTLPDPCADGKEDSDPTQEIAHAALIPKGTYAGYVLLWREMETVDGNCRCHPANTTFSWLFSPINPQTLIRIDQEIPSNLLCAGVTWDPTGKLIAAGGGVGLVASTFKFRPNVLGMPSLDESGFAVIYSTGGLPWLALGQLHIPHYYPTLITLGDEPVFGTGACTPNPIPGGSTLCLGGPPDITNEGNEFWELMSPGNDFWHCPILPENPTGPDPNKQAEPNSPHYASHTPSPFDEYARPNTGTAMNPIFAERLLDTYPRAYVMSNGDIVIEGDVDTATEPPNAPGSSLVIRPRYFSPGMWQLMQGPFTNGSLIGGAPDPTYDRHYGGSVLLHEQGQPPTTFLDRVLVIGGSYDANYFGATPPGSAPSWVVNDTIRELEKGSPDPFVNAGWRDKISDPLLQRVFVNAVVLPTGEILIVGGSQTDDEAHYLHPYPTPVNEPVIYDPGTLPSDPGTIYCMDPGDLQPSGSAGEECATTPVPRLYHSIAVLLLDGRVLVAGGHWSGGCYPDSRFNGEIFSPPYLSESWRPTVTDAPSSASFGSQFQIKVDRQAGNSIDRVVLLRPAAVTHHNDYDQRYIELSHSLVSTTGGPTIETDTLAVTALGNNLGPPGHYMLFAIETNGATPPVRVPSVGVVLKVP